MGCNVPRGDEYIAYAAGILPYARYKGLTVFLVGKDAQDGAWSDFGGKYETRDRCQMETAQREFQEETCGCVMTRKALRSRMFHAHNYRLLESLTQAKHPYYMYLMEIPFDPLVRRTFERVVDFIRFSKMPKSMVEKTDLQWVTLQQLKTSKLRSVFQATIERHQGLLQAL